MPLSANTQDQNLHPTQAMGQNAALGLELHHQFNRGGTEVGLNRAKQLKDRQTLSVEDIKSIYSYFKRHEVDKQAKDFHNRENPSAGYIAWLLWGGDAGYEWVKQKHELLETQAD